MNVDVTPPILQSEESRLIEWRHGLQSIAAADPDARAVLKRVDRNLDIVHQMRRLYAELRRDHEAHGRPSR
jgi:hypothetical protein